MKKIIFSIWTDYSTYGQPKYFAEQWAKYKNILIQRHEKYAELCQANYKIFNVNHNREISYTNLNFLKIHLAKQLTNNYDKVLYMDLDVVPQTKTNFFKYHDENFDKFLCHKTLAPRWKIARKKIMLLSEGIETKHDIINTGVFGITNKIANMIQLEEREVDIKKKYPEFPPNNEVYMSYIIEKYKIPCHDIGMGWNFVLDSVEKKPTSGCHFLHISHKNFNLVL